MGFLLLIPFFLIRFGLLSVLSKNAVARAAHFAPLSEREKGAYWVYQISNGAILFWMFFLKVSVTPSALLYTGIAVYTGGALLLAASVVGFASPAESGINQSGIYLLSRNPMYVSYFIFFVGCALLTQSLLLMGFVLVFQIASHWIIRSEERWCVEQFGEAYLEYMKRVRRYF